MTEYLNKGQHWDIKRLNEFKEECDWTNIHVVIIPEKSTVPCETKYKWTATCTTRQDHLTCLGLLMAHGLV